MDSVSKRIKLRLNELGMKQADLAKKDVANKSTISMWLNGNSIPSNERLVKLANALKVSTTWLLSGEEDNLNTSEHISSNTEKTVSFAPLLFWSQLNKGINMNKLQLSGDEKQFPLVPNASKESFYLEVQGISNAPYYQDGEKICIDPSFALEDIETGEMVVVSFGDAAVFRALLKSESKMYLKALNKEWQPNILEINDQCTFIGKYVGSFKEPVKHQLT